MDKFLELFMRLLVPVICTYAFILLRKALVVLLDKLGVEKALKDSEIIDTIIENSVRAVEEISRKRAMSSLEKEELALNNIRKMIGNEQGGLDDEFFRIKIKSFVNIIYNNDRRE